MFLAQWKATRAVTGTNAMLSMPPAPTPSSFSPSNTSKEYIYAGGRLIATKESATSASPPALPPGQENVFWTNMVGVTATPTTNGLTKTASDGWSAGATSTKAIASGDGYVEFTADAFNARMCGLSHGDSNQSFTDIDYAIQPNAVGMIEVWESGNFKWGGSLSYQVGDHFRVAVESNQIKYYLIHNGVPNQFYTSQIAPTYPLQVDTSLYYTNATISNVIITGDNLQNISSPSQNIVWTNPAGVTVSGNSLTKTGTEGWNAGASSTKAIASGNGYVEFTATAYNARMMGLSHTDANQSYATIDYALQPSATGMIDIWESGNFVSGGTYSYQPGDRFRVAIESENSVTYVRYYRISNGVMTLLYGHTITPNYPLMADTSLYYTGAAINDAVISGTLTP